MDVRTPNQRAQVGLADARMWERVGVVIRFLAIKHHQQLSFDFAVTRKSRS